MKTRLGFVSNSSSSSFIIRNKTKSKKTLVDFVKENPQLIRDFVDEYSYGEDDGYTQKELIESAEKNDFVFDPKENKQCNFGDRDGTLIGRVFDYILRNGGKSKSFSWSFDKHCR